MDFIFPMAGNQGKNIAVFDFSPGPKTQKKVAKTSMSDIFATSYKKF